MKIAILSGKGGVGKSSVIASLAVGLKDKVKLMLVDTDVDCPNLHLLFPGREKEKKILEASSIAMIDKSKCRKCGACRKACKFGAIESSDEGPTVNEFFCEGCGACKIVCPNDAITIEPVPTGEAKVLEGQFPFVYGQLYAGRPGSGKIVHDVRTMADKVAEEKKIELMLIDAAAGIGCPVIASIMGCNYVIGVVEPTQASIRDLERALKVVDHFKIPHGVVMNKVGISKKNEQEIRRKWQLLAELPYDSQVPRLLARRLPPIQGEGRIKDALIKLCTKVEEVTKND